MIDLPIKKEGFYVCVCKGSDCLYYGKDGISEDGSETPLDLDYDTARYVAIEVNKHWWKKGYTTHVGYDHVGKNVEAIDPTNPLLVLNV